MNYIIHRMKGMTSNKVTWFMKPDTNDLYRFHCCTYAQQTPVCPDPEFSFIFLHFYLVLYHVRCYTVNSRQEGE